MMMTEELAVLDQQFTDELDPEAARLRTDFVGGIVQLSDFISGEIKSREYVVEELIPVGFPGFFYAPGGRGKGFVMAELTTATALGTPFYGYAVPKPRKVLLFTPEWDELEAKIRYRALHKARFSQWTVEEFERRLGDNLAIHHMGSLAPFLPLDIEADSDLIEAAIKSVGAEVCILDPLNGLHSRDENSNSEMGRVLASLRRVSNETSCTFILVHHCSKADSTKGINTSMRGAVALRSNTQWCFALEPHPGDTQGETDILRLRHEKANLGPRVYDIWMQRGEGGILNPITEEEANEIAGNKSNTADAKAAILEAVHDGVTEGKPPTPSSLKGVERVPRNHETRMSLLREMEDEGLIKMYKEGTLSGDLGKGKGTKILPADHQLIVTTT